MYGATFAYPPVRIEMTIGVSTAHGISPIKEKILSSKESIPISPHPKGKKRGNAAETENLTPIGEWAGLIRFR